jgi:glyoxylase-like metal-dependent hydrolase (beta-lactamase superfamily II)
MKFRRIGAIMFLLSLFIVQGLPQSVGSLSVDVNKLSDRVAVFKIHGGNANIVALNSEKGIVVFDTDVSPSFAALLRKKMTEVFGREDFAYVINTHSHGDHTYGNQVFADAIIIGHENCSEEMIKSSERIQGTIAGLKGALGQMKGGLEKMEEGSDQARGMAQRIAYYEAMLQGYEKDFILTPPSIVFREGMTLHLGNLTLDLMYFGASHSTSDILIHCPQEGLWVTGDLFFPGVDLYIDSERVLALSRWIATLEKIVQTETDTKIIVPGHEELLTMEELKNKLEYVKAKQEEFAGKESAFFAFKKVFEEKGLDPSLQVLKDLTAKPEKFYTLHPEIDQFAYRLMLNEKLDEAAAIFVVLAELFPDSYLAFDSLGEVYKRMGDNEKAIQNFEKSLELNPDNRNAAQQLKSLREKK